jgi:hypothetical protein
VNKQDNVQASTGQGDGFRFDTDGSLQLETAKDKRRVRLDFTAGYEQHATTLKGVDFRFGGDLLNLCAIPEGSSGTVPTVLSFASSVNGVLSRLVYGGFTPGGGDNCGGRGVSSMTVTRLSHTEWRVASGPSACFYVNAAFQGILIMPMSFTLTAQGPVP